jgi:hypothetical protein
MIYFPISKNQYLTAIARETAKLSYPGSMSRGEKQILTKGAKRGIEKFFTGDTFGFNDLWDNVENVKLQYADWHKKSVQALGKFLETNSLLGNRDNNAEAISSKLIDTYMYQSMKSEKFRLLRDKLHLPLDRIIISTLLKFKESLPLEVNLILTKYKNHPYQFPYTEYMGIQEALFLLIRKINDELTQQPDGKSRQLTSRIELNLLWAENNGQGQ